MNTLLSQLYKRRDQIIFCQMFSLAKCKTVFTNLVLFCLRFPVCSLWLVKETIQSWIAFVVLVTKRNTWEPHSCWLIADCKCIPGSPCKIFLKYLSCSAVSLSAPITWNSVNNLFFAWFCKKPAFFKFFFFYSFETVLYFCHSSACFLPVF